MGILKLHDYMSENNKLNETFNKHLRLLYTKLNLLTENLVDKGMIKVPKEVGLVNIPSNHIRLFHYLSKRGEFKDSTTEKLIDSVEKNGLLLKYSRDEAGDPKPGLGIWTSANIDSYKGSSFTFVELQVRLDDPDIVLAGGRPIDVNKGVSHYSHDHIVFYRDIKPTEFIAIHEPWHRHYRYIIEDGDSLIQQALDGEFDDDHTIDIVKAIHAIKVNYGNNYVD